MVLKKKNLKEQVIGGYWETIMDVVEGLSKTK